MMPKADPDILQIFPERITKCQILCTKIACQFRTKEERAGRGKRGVRRQRVSKEKRSERGRRKRGTC